MSQTMNGTVLSKYTFSFVIDKNTSAVGDWYLESVVVYDFFLRNTSFSSGTPFFVVNSFEPASTTGAPVQYLYSKRF